MSNEGDRVEMASDGDFGVLSDAQRAQYEAIARKLAQTVQNTQEIRDGYTFRFPLAVWGAVTDFVLLERKCCPFLRFELSLTDGDDFSLTLRGRDDDAAFVKAEVEALRLA